MLDEDLSEQEANASVLSNYLLECKNKLRSVYYVPVVESVVMRLVLHT